MGHLDESMAFQRRSNPRSLERCSCTVTTDQERFVPAGRSMRGMSSRLNGCVVARQDQNSDESSCRASCEQAGIGNSIAHTTSNLNFIREKKFYERTDCPSSTSETTNDLWLDKIPDDVGINCHTNNRRNTTDSYRVQDSENGAREADGDEHNGGNARPLLQLKQAVPNKSDHGAESEQEDAAN